MENYSNKPNKNFISKKNFFLDQWVVLTMVQTQKKTELEGNKKTAQKKISGMLAQNTKE